MSGDLMMDMRHLDKTGMGETPDDIQEKCLKLCQDYLGGQWLKQSKDTITVKRLTGGMLNQLYYCAINDTNNNAINGTIDGTTEDRDVPKEVAIKITQKKPFLEESENEEKNRLLGELIVTLMVSENGLGPKVYGVFEGGVILEYYQQEAYTVKHQEDDGIVGEVFGKLAALHAMEPPIQRNTKTLYTRWFTENYEEAIKWDFIGDMVKGGYQLFIDNDYHEENKWITNMVENLKSPIVFTHNDYRSDNIMVLKNRNIESDKRIVICDYEFSVYGNRGMDFLHIVKEWGNENAFFDRQNLYYPPEDSVLERLLQYYFDQSVRSLGEQWAKNPLNSIKQLIKEIKVYWLLMQFSTALPFMKLLDENHTVPPEMLRFFGGKRPEKVQIMKMADHGYGNYLKLKNKLLKDVS